MSGVPMSGAPAQPDPYAAPDPYAQPDPYGAPMSAPGGQPMSPGVASAPPYGQPMAGAPGQPGYPQDPYAQQQQWAGPVIPPTQGGGSKAWIWGALAGVVVVALMVGVVLYVTGGDDETPVADSSATPSEEVDPSTEPSEEAPDTELVTDPATGLSFAPMPEPWRDSTANYGVIGFYEVTGQVLDVLTFEDGSGWIATFVVGEINPSQLGSSSMTTDDAINALADLVDGAHYSKPPDFTEPLDGLERNEVEVNPLTVGSYSGSAMSYHLSWDDDSIEETGESIALGVLDMGDGRTAGFFLSLPDSVPDEHLDQMLEALDSLTFV
ncbi:hypothetical protein FB566_4258 [Stackebrandtia endophytica]|uniref:Uncharacterized protein n=2 Tax=Stackebrandtia endophytica TaxID=1496996 RepID=A0A543B1F4_9ACTN|nr:hypothetical protein FB566_4258 [Stackebrandtia endophytica]